MQHIPDSHFSDLSEESPGEPSAACFPEEGTSSPTSTCPFRDLTGFDEGTYPLLRPGLALKNFGQVSLVVDSVTSEKIKLSRNSARILLLCDGRRTVQDICAQYARPTEHGTPGACEAREILEAFFERGVLLPGRSRRTAGGSE